MISKLIGLFLAFAVMSQPGHSSTNSKPATGGFDHSHASFDAVLKETVVWRGNQTRVDYKKLKKKRRKELNAYTDSLSNVTQAEYDSFTADEKLAFLINVYNAYTLKLIVDNYPLKSIKDLGSLFNSPWKKKFFKLFGKKTSLDKVEHGMIRQDFKEPRIHFAVNCASIGCPPLADEAFTAKKLDSQLEIMTKKFFTDPERNLFRPKKGKLKLSKILDWYEDDFLDYLESKGKPRDIRLYVAPYMSQDIQLQNSIKSKSVRVSHFGYDWNLNDTATWK